MGFKNTSFNWNSAGVYNYYYNTNGATNGGTIVGKQYVQSPNYYAVFAWSRIKLETDEKGVKDFSFSLPASDTGGEALYWKLSQTATTTLPQVPGTQTWRNGKACVKTSSALTGSETGVNLAANTTWYLYLFYNYNTQSSAGLYRQPVTVTGTDNVVPGNITAKVDGTDVAAADIGSTVDLTYGANLTSTYKVKFTFTETDGTTKTIWLGGSSASQAISGTSIAWNTGNDISSLSAGVTDAAGIAGTVTVETIYSGATVGTKTKALTLNFTQANAGMTGANGWMTVSLTQPQEASGFTVYVEKYSRASLALDAAKLSWPAGVTGSLAGWTVKVGSQAAAEKTASAATHLSDSIQDKGTVPVTVTARDARGFTVTYTAEITVYAYELPAGSMEFQRTDSAGDEASQGNWLTIEPKITISDVNGENAITGIALAATPRDGSSGFTFDDDHDGLANNTAVTVGGSLGDKTYDLTLTVTDRLGNSLVLRAVLPSAKWLIKARADGNGIAFGKTPDAANVFQVTENWKMLHGVNLVPEVISGTGGTTAGGVTALAAGTYLLITAGAAASLCGVFVIATASGLCVKLAGAADVTAALSGTDLTVTTASGTCSCMIVRLTA